MRRWLRVLTTPSCWIQIHSYSAVWDKKLRQALQEHKFRRAFYLDDDPAYAPYAKKVDPYAAWLGPYRLWVSNHPYGSFTVAAGPRPKRITILEAHDKMLEDIL